MVVTQDKITKLTEALKVVMGLDEVWDNLDPYHQETIQIVAKWVVEGSLNLDYTLTLWFVTKSEFSPDPSWTYTIEVWWRRLLPLKAWRKETVTETIDENP